MTVATTRLNRMHDDARLGRAGFRPRATLDDSPETRRQVAFAIARAKSGDREALRFLYVKYSGNVYGYVRSIVRDDYEAEDVTQHVFAKLMTVLHKYNVRGVPFFAWLLRLARNAAIDLLRSQRASPSEAVVARTTESYDDGSDRALCLR